MDHNKERFAKDSEAVKMYRLVTDFFLKELKLDFVTQEEIEHMIGAFTNKQQPFNNHRNITIKAFFLPVSNEVQYNCL